MPGRALPACLLLLRQATNYIKRKHASWAEGKMNIWKKEKEGKEHLNMAATGAQWPVLQAWALPPTSLTLPCLNPSETFSEEEKRAACLAAEERLGMEDWAAAAGAGRAEEGGWLPGPSSACWLPSLLTRKGMPSQSQEEGGLVRHAFHASKVGGQRRP